MLIIQGAVTTAEKQKSVQHSNNIHIYIYTETWSRLYPSKVVSAEPRHCTCMPLTILSHFLLENISGDCAPLSVPFQHSVLVKLQQVHVSSFCFTWICSSNILSGQHYYYITVISSSIIISSHSHFIITQNRNDPWCIKKLNQGYKYLRNIRLRPEAMERGIWKQWPCGITPQKNVGKESEDTAICNSSKHKHGHYHEMINCPRPVQGQLSKASPRVNCPKPLQGSTVQGQPMGTEVCKNLLPLYNPPQLLSVVT